MKPEFFFATTNINIINESLKGKKFLTTSHDEEGNIVLVFESAYENLRESLTIMRDGSLDGVFACDEDTAHLVNKDKSTIVVSRNDIETFRADCEKLKEYAEG